MDRTAEYERLARDALAAVGKQEEARLHPTPIHALVSVALNQATILRLGAIKAPPPKGCNCACCLKRKEPIKAFFYPCKVPGCDRGWMVSEGDAVALDKVPQECEHHGKKEA